MRWYRESEDGMSVEPVAMEFCNFNERWHLVTELPNGCEVSTVFLALDHRFIGEGPPIVYESMVFPPGESSELAMRRYCTRIEAQGGHEELVEEWAHKPESEWGVEQ